MKKLALLVVFMISFPTVAFHIVGGEIEFITIAPGRYQINVVQYFDEAQDENPGPEPDVTIFIFRNSDNVKMSEHTLFLSSQSNVNYTNDSCSIEALQTSRVVWTGYIELDPEEYADPKGYYVVWERCCRNNGVRNIINPEGTGMKYVSEIPPLWKNGKPFINSSPVLFKPLSDYACINQLYYVEFTGQDPDGDSLAYSLTTPLNSSAAVALPIPQPKPHPLVFFQNGYDANNMIPGNPPLRISRKGLLTVEPQRTGLHVFSVLVEEFRNGVKLGHVQRDFQMLVIDGCKPPDPPVVGVKIPGNDNFQPELDTLVYALADDKCFEFIITNITDGETISLRAEGVNFDGKINEIFEFNTFPVGTGEDSIIVNVCAPGCPPLLDGPFIIDLIAGDNACPLPQLDTFRLMMMVEPPPNRMPIFSPAFRQYVVDEGDEIDIALRAIDHDGDSIDMSYFVVGIDDPQTIGVSMYEGTDRGGEVTGNIRWNTDCSVYDFSEQSKFDLYVKYDDKDECEVEQINLQHFTLEVNLPPNTQPIVTASPLSGDTLTVLPREVIAFDVVATDVDGDELTLRMAGDEFNPLAYGASFTGAAGQGPISSPFSWSMSCSILDPDAENTFTLFFIADDEDKCGITNYDTLSVTINVKIPENSAPEIIPIGAFDLEINVPFELNINGLDIDGDSIVLQLYSGRRPPDSPSLEFETVGGTGTVTGQLLWQPECELLIGGAATSYDLWFLIRDDKCPVAKIDTAIGQFTIEDTRINFDNFLPPNAFSPNGDGVNDVFTLWNQLNPESNLPVDNCDDAFEYVTIHDRSGTTIYRSDERDFQWTGGSHASGVYYYMIRYTNTVYKNYIQLLR